MLLRVEDTDQKRFVPGSMDRFIDDLNWLGITFDEPPVIQSEHTPRHREIAHELVRRGAAYYEPTTEDVHGQKRSEEEYRAGRVVYRGQNRDLAEQPEGPFVVRLKVPEGAIALDDVVRGRVEVDLATIDDQVLLKSDGMATYHLAAMVDDHDMQISHIIRSEEWLPSTPKHLLIFKAMEWEVPIFAHLPVILAPDGKKLSKRIHGESVWVSTYRKAGYLPEALTNYLALLGWNPGGDRELLSGDELIQLFSLERVHKAGAKFDQEKLNAFQQHYVRELSDEELIKRVTEFVQNQGVTIRDEQNFGRTVTILKDRISTFDGVCDLAKPFIPNTESLYDPSLLIFRKSTKETSLKGLETATQALGAAGDETWSSEESLSQVLDRVVASTGLTNGDVFWPVRVALTGLERSPSPAECLWALGKDESIKRLHQGLAGLR